MSAIDDLSAELLQLQMYIYAFEFEGAFTMGYREAAQLRTELAERKIELLAELDAALTWGERLAGEANEMRVEDIES